LKAQFIFASTSPISENNPFKSISPKAMEPEKEKEIVIGAAEAAAKFFRDPRSHGAPKEYTTQVTAVISLLSNTAPCIIYFCKNVSSLLYIFDLSFFSVFRVL
jgi:hypothetical protein